MILFLITIKDYIYIVADFFTTAVFGVLICKEMLNFDSDATVTYELKSSTAALLELNTDTKTLTLFYIAVEPVTRHETQKSSQPF